MVSLFLISCPSLWSTDTAHTQVGRDLAFLFSYLS
jgi:hypothetical protein